MNSTEVKAIHTVEHDGKVYRPKETFSLPSDVAVELRDLGAVSFTKSNMTEEEVGESPRPRTYRKRRR